MAALSVSCIQQPECTKEKYLKSSFGSRRIKTHWKIGKKTYCDLHSYMLFVGHLLWKLLHSWCLLALDASAIPAPRGKRQCSYQILILNNLEDGAKIKKLCSSYSVHSSSFKTSNYNLVINLWLSLNQFKFCKR